MTEAQKRFFSRIDSLGTGDRAALRRETGRLLRHADGRAVAVFYSCMPFGVEGWQEERWFAAACLRCLWDAGPEGGKPFEQILSDLIRAGELSDSTRHRVEILLDTGWDSDGYMLTKLARIVKLVRQKSDRAMIDFACLLEDLLHWNNESQTVQRKWARTIFSTYQPNESEE